VLTQVYYNIVVIHGLGGDVFNTWTHPKSKVFWLKDFFSRQILDIRIMTFGYNAALTFGQLTAEMINYAKNLLSNLVNKRKEMEVQNMTKCRVKKEKTLTLC
jgi:hypothetical protein